MSTFVTPAGMAANIMDVACLPEALVNSGVDRALRESIAKAIEETYEEAHAAGFAAGRDDLQRSLRSLLGCQR